MLIPGVNDEHLKEVSKIVKAKGAFLHNVMPLIAEAEHGTYYGIMGQRGPTPDELQDLQDACAGDMNMMRHCRQCRADAVGLLGEDRGAEFTMDKIEVMEIDYEAAMVRAKVRARRDQREARTPSAACVKPKARRHSAFRPRLPRPVLMAVAGKNGVVAEHFGHAKEFLIYEASPAGVRFIGHRKTELYCGGMRYLRRWRRRCWRNESCSTQHPRARRLRSRALLQDRLRTLGQAGSRRHPAERRACDGADRGSRDGGVHEMRRPAS